ncbi:hypothetical protein K1719_022409 [Acacia pycnantha]|nr:hypothetical protein K1719_022409 [Acacia pycnantha]
MRRESSAEVKVKFVGRSSPWPLNIRKASKLLRSSLHQTPTALHAHTLSIPTWSEFQIGANALLKSKHLLTFPLLSESLDSCLISFLDLTTSIALRANIMAENLKSLKLVCVWLLLASYFLVIAEARPYPVEHSEKSTLEGLNMRGMKTGGPSSRGSGHSSTDSRNLRAAATMSGPSPGVGH